METLDVSTVVYLPPGEIYEFLVDFPRYGDYSEHLSEIRSHGDGSPGTEYELTFAWWKLAYTARSAVTSVDPPNRIDWELVRDLDAHGSWEIAAEPSAGPPARESASRVHFVVHYAPASASPDAIDLPALTSFEWVLSKVQPKIEAEAERVLKRVVSDLEGEQREVSLTVHETPDLH